MKSSDSNTTWVLPLQDGRFVIGTVNPQLAERAELPPIGIDQLVNELGKVVGCLDQYLVLKQLRAKKYLGLMTRQAVLGSQEL